MRQNHAAEDVGFAARAAAEELAREGRGLRILHVEDDDVDARIVAHFLAAIASPPLQVDRARSVDEAARLLKERAYDLCLLDFWLGGHTSLEVVARIDASGRRLPIVVLSGVVGADAREFALMAGAADCLAKNEITAARLAAAIETAIRKDAPGAPA